MRETTKANCTNDNPSYHQRVDKHTPPTRLPLEGAPKDNEKEMRNKLGLICGTELKIVQQENYTEWWPALLDDCIIADADYLLWPDDRPPPIRLNGTIKK